MAEISLNYSIEELVREDINRVLEIENDSFRSPWQRAVFETEFKKKKS